MQRILLIANEQQKYNDFIYEVISENITINILDNFNTAALLKLSSKEYNIIIIDDKSSEKGSFSNIEFIKREYKKSKIVFVSSYMSKELPRGIDEFVTQEIFLKNYREIMELHGMEFNINKVQSIIEETHETVKEVERGKKIVVVDDDTISLEILSNILSYDGYCVESYDDASKVLEEFKLLNRYNDISLIVLDLVMPRIDGYYLLKRIRKINGFENIPVIIATGKNDAESVEKAIKYKVNGYIVKPYNSNLILQKVEECIN